MFLLLKSFASIVHLTSCKVTVSWYLCLYDWIDEIGEMKGNGYPHGENLHTLFIEDEYCRYVHNSISHNQDLHCRKFISLISLEITGDFYSKFCSDKSCIFIHITQSFCLRIETVFYLFLFENWWGKTITGFKKLENTHPDQRVLNRKNWQSLYLHESFRLI